PRLQEQARAPSGGADDLGLPLGRRPTPADAGDAGRAARHRLVARLHGRSPRPQQGPSRDPAGTQQGPSRDPAGRAFVSFRVEEGRAPWAPTAGRIGLDRGGAALVTRSTAEKITPPTRLAGRRRRLKTALERLARRQTGATTREEARLTRLTRL